MRLNLNLIKSLRENNTTEIELLDASSCIDHLSWEDTIYPISLFDIANYMHLYLGKPELYTLVCHMLRQDNITLSYQGQFDLDKKIVMACVLDDINFIKSQHPVLFTRILPLAIAFLSNHCLSHIILAYQAELHPSFSRTIASVFNVSSDTTETTSDEVSPDQIRLKLVMRTLVTMPVLFKEVCAEVWTRKKDKEDAHIVLWNAAVHKDYRFRFTINFLHTLFAIKETILENEFDELLQIFIQNTPIDRLPMFSQFFSESCRTNANQEFKKHASIFTKCVRKMFPLLTVKQQHQLARAVQAAEQYFMEQSSLGKKVKSSADAFFSIFSQFYKPNVDSFIKAITHSAYAWALTLVGYVSEDELRNYRFATDDSTIFHLLFEAHRSNVKTQREKLALVSQLLTPELLFHKNKHGYAPVDVAFYFMMSDDKPSNDNLINKDLFTSEFKEKASANFAAFQHSQPTHNSFGIPIIPKPLLMVWDSMSRGRPLDFLYSETWFYRYILDEIFPLPNSIFRYMKVSWHKSANYLLQINNKNIISLYLIYPTFVNLD